MPQYVLPLFAPALMLLAALALARWPAPRGHWMLRLPEFAVFASSAIALVITFGLIVAGPGTGPTLGVAGIGLSARVDSVSVAMFALVCFIGWVVLRYARTYTDGEARQPAFMAWMAAALAAVMGLVTAGNLGQLLLAWVAVGFALDRLLLFYPDRIAAQRAARKKALTGLAGSFTLLAAAALLIVAYGTGDIATIAAMAREGLGGAPALWAAGLLAVAAILKSAQFPTHGWLTEVMEAPTPVSALLHAGVVNAGGFLLIRFADVMLTAPGVLAVLVMVGGFSALFGGLVMLTQPAIKTALAWSTLAQMGFMLLQCGLAIFPLALLHILAHSLYKAHAFLGSGSAVTAVASIRRPGPVAVPNGWAVARAFALALAIYGVIGALFGFVGKPPQAVALGAILVFGVAYLVAQGLADAAPRDLTRRTALASVAATLSYFALQVIAMKLTADALPATPAPGPLEWALMVLAIISFGTVAVAQALFPLWAGHPAAAGLRVHLLNGLYVNAVFDRLIGGWRTSNRT
jgi:NAD(P)H-quinone oxidoreductase subunit 5